MIERSKSELILEALDRQAAVAIIGPRQVGKTTLALQIAESRDSLYLDLERRADRNKISEPELFLQNYEDKLVILDEIHRVPELFQELRGIIDKGRRKGLRTGRFLILGSASIDLLRQSGESLAGRIEYVDLEPFNSLEIGGKDKDIQRLWLRGGFPDSYLAKSDNDSFRFRRSFIRTYLERDVPLLGPRIASEALERLWTMLAHSQGGLLNSSRLSANLSVSAPTVTSYVDLLVDLLLVRRLQPFNRNIGKRLVKSPKVYVRDSGLVHALLGITDFNELSGHPVVGHSWEGFVIENILSVVPEGTKSSFYRTSAGAEIDLILELPKRKNPWAIEIKRSLTAQVEKGFHFACEDIGAKKQYVICPGTESYPVSKKIEAIGLAPFLELLSKL